LFFSRITFIFVMKWTEGFSFGGFPYSPQVSSSSLEIKKII